MIADKYLLLRRLGTVVGIGKRCERRKGKRCENCQWFLHYSCHKHSPVAHDEEASFWPAVTRWDDCGDWKKERRK